MILSFVQRELPDLRQVRIICVIMTLFSNQDYFNFTLTWKCDKGTLKHCLHCVAYIVSITLFFKYMVKPYEIQTDDIIAEFGLTRTILYYVLYTLPVLALPRSVLVFLGLIFFNTFPRPPTLRAKPWRVPFIVVRVVTKGDFPNLVQTTVQRNIDAFEAAGLENFLIEVLTEKPQNIRLNRKKWLEVLVPETYRTKRNTLYRGRNLQYAIENRKHKKGTWIVHLDEDTVLTPEAAIGIANLAWDDERDMGQGRILCNDEYYVRNWKDYVFFSLFDGYFMMTHFGMMRFYYTVTGRAHVGAIGTFFVCRSDILERVSFDMEPKYSITEDVHFALKASQMGYSIDWIEGDVYNQSVTSFRDVIDQRARWLRGMMNNVANPAIKMRHKFLIFTFVANWCLSFPCMLVLMSEAYFPCLPGFYYVHYVKAFLLAVDWYVDIYAVIQTKTLTNGRGEKFDNEKLLLFRIFITIFFELPAKILVYVASSFMAFNLKTYHVASKKDC